MGNSTKSLQSVVDFCATIGDLNPFVSVGGYSAKLPIEVANEVITEMIAQRFNWKFNRMIVPPFYSISWQQDYATINLKTIGWLEHAVAVDINNTALPKPIFYLECVRDLERTGFQFGRPEKICWLPNDQLVQDVWPGAAYTYTNPLGAINTPSNKLINILDANGNILILTTFGTTGVVAPAAPAASASGVVVNDGTCVWTVADPKAQGFRLSPLPPQTGLVYQLYVIAQARPVMFTDLAQLLDPIPDDYAKYFQDGFIAKMHRHSAAPIVRNRYQQMNAEWMLSLAAARGQGDRERDDNGFVPTRGIMDTGSGAQPIGPAWPYGPFGQG